MAQKNHTERLKNLLSRVSQDSIKALSQTEDLLETDHLDTVEEEVETGEYHIPFKGGSFFPST